MSNPPPLPTKDRLIRAAAELFRSRGYNGVGVSEVLSRAKAPKGSLYHHFPNGKSDLALAASTWASDGMLRLIAASFEPAECFDDGVVTLCHKLAKFFDSKDMWGGCPITSTLFEGPATEDFRAHARYLVDGWIAEVEHHARRLGVPANQAAATAEHLYMLVQGGWQLAKARQQSDVLRHLPAQLNTDRRQ
ncbi:TetR/AcrR family transcriptional regulator [Seohaeicola saemankumensis]|nr:TetR/AcrR family transcriptional regulator [Seohaeicola saemankumensis]MCA0871718.1 TetR/AcrR family transcriptional regulator [Seohaeicola saemankumensis]